MNKLNVKPEQLIRKTSWKIVPFDCKDSDCIIAYLDGQFPVKLKTYGTITQKEFNRLF